MKTLTWHPNPKKNLFNTGEAQAYIESVNDPINRRLLQNALGGMFTMAATNFHGELIDLEHPFDALFFVKAIEKFLNRGEALIEVLSGGRTDTRNDFFEDF